MCVYFKPIVVLCFHIDKTLDIGINDDIRYELFDGFEFFDGGIRRSRSGDYYYNSDSKAIATVCHTIARQQPTDC